MIPFGPAALETAATVARRIVGDDTQPVLTGSENVAVVVARWLSLSISGFALANGHGTRAAVLAPRQSNRWSGWRIAALEFSVVGRPHIECEGRRVCSRSWS
jgi:hypothetical protein